MGVGARTRRIPYSGGDDLPPIRFALATVGWPASYVEKLRECLEAEEFVHTRDDAEIERHLDRAEVVVLAGDLDERHLAAPRLRWVHCDHAGLNRSAYPEVFAKGLRVTSSAGRSAPALAEHALFFMLSFTYQVRALLEAQRDHRWGVAGQDTRRGLYGRTVGIVGLGNTGRELAVRCAALGMRVLGYRRSAIEIPGVDSLYAAERGETIDELLRESDFVVLAVPLSDATHHLIGAPQLAIMKPGAVLVNMARGAVVDETALIDALREQRIGGAGLDVFAREPLPPESPLWDLPNVIITPHATPQVPDRTGRSLEIIRENARRYRADEPMLNLLGPEDVWTGER
jgi:phosphoglycerate dehydrogenase-like enzyme